MGIILWGWGNTFRYFQVITHYAMENLMKHWGELSLNDREEGDFRLSEDKSVKEYTIATKFLTKRALNTKSIVRTFNAIWRSVNGFKVRNVGNHIVLFTFDNEEEVGRIFEGEP